MASPSNQNATATPQVTRISPSELAIRVSGNHLINKQGQTVRLIGVNVPAGVGCVATGNAPAGVLTAPPTAQTATAMANWHINAVRITMNEDCWLGINGVNPAYSGSTYQNTIINFVQLLHSYGMYVILDLHVNAPGTILATSQQVMADADHAATYWKSVATTFKNDHAVIFDAYNEPHITSTNAQASNPWQCWRNGCTVTVLYQGHNQPVPGAAPWQGLGMQELVDAIRSTGATNPIMVGGLNFAQDLTQLLQNLPTDPLHQLITSYHNYKGPRNTPAYWDNVIAPIAEQMPVVTGEFGEKDCQTTFVTEYMNWADQNGVSYLAWAWWTPTGCGALGLLSNYDGTPSAYGQAFYDHFRAVNPVS
jgi:endoglucanase